MNHMLSPNPARSSLDEAMYIHMGLSSQLGNVARRDAPDALVSRTAVPTVRTGYTVLLVEDDPGLQRTMSKHLARMNVRVLTASHYRAALAHLALGPPDLACVDIGLPSESGFELCEYIRGPLGLKSLPIVMTSESDWPAAMADAEAAGANAFLPKPFSMAELGASIIALLEAEPPRAATVRLRAA